MTYVLADVRDHPVVAPYHPLGREAAEVRAAPLAREGEVAIRQRAEIGLALSFDAWRILIREQGPSDEQALVRRLAPVASRAG